MIYRFILLLTLLSSNYLSADLMKPTSLSKDLYDIKILNGNYDPSIEHPDNFLDFDYGTRVASPLQIENAIKAYSNQFIFICLRLR